MGKLKGFVKRLYKFKIRLMFLFNIGYGELVNLIAIGRDLAIILAFLDINLKINLGWRIDIGLFCLCFLIFVVLGLILKQTGMTDYNNMISNSVNPEIRLVNEIARKMGIIKGPKTETPKSIKEI